MQQSEAQGLEQRVLILAPRGKNASLIEMFLARAGIPTRICRDMDEFCAALQSGPAGAIIAEEVFNAKGVEQLTQTLEQQPPWSEIPLIVLTRAGETTRSSLYVARAFSPRANVMALERPVRVLTLVSATQSMLRARRRQYELRDLLSSERGARAEAEAASRAKDQFLAALSHELRTPLNPITLALSLIDRDSGLSGESRELLDTIRRSVTLETKLIDDLLDMTRIARGKIELRHEAIDLHALISHAVRTCQADDGVAPRPIALQLQADNCTAWGDWARISQVLWNLIKNAMKFTPTSRQITISTKNPDASSISVSVIDDGEGIEPQALTRIFSAFEQEGRLTTRRFGGLGLGLAICKALIEMHGGTIDAHSDGKGRGATFTFVLKTVSAATSSRPEPCDNHGPARQSESRGAVLLVEDHPETARLLTLLLRRLGFEVVLAKDCAAAIQCAGSRRFDLLLSDIGLPDGTGHDVMRHVREHHQIPGIAVSGFGLEEDRRRSREAGFSEHFTKPIEIDKLMNAIARVTNKNTCPT